VPVVSTFHGRLDMPYADGLLADPPAGLVAISRNQASTHPEVPFSVVHNGLRLGEAPFGKQRTDALCFVGRVVPEKGIVESIEIAKAVGRPLKIAAKVAAGGVEREYYDEVFAPALKAAGPSIEYLGEVSQEERDQLFAESYAALMPGSWPGTVRPRRHRSAGMRHASRRPAHGRAAGDRPRWHRRVLR
jgi:glycosyltransferase involved in cell wall biosynthesis